MLLLFVFKKLKKSNLITHRSFSAIIVFISTCTAPCYRFWTQAALVFAATSLLRNEALAEGVSLVCSLGCHVVVVVECL